MSIQTRQESPNRRFPISLVIAAGYLIVAGTYGLVGILLPLALNLGTRHPEFFTAKSLLFKIGFYSRDITIAALLLISGIGLCFRKSWARTLALVMLGIATFYSSFSFAWDFANGKPDRPVLALSIAIVGAWNAMWFILIFKRTSREAIITQPKPDGDGLKPAP